MDVLLEENPLSLLVTGGGGGGGVDGLVPGLESFMLVFIPFGKFPDPIIFIF